MMGARGSGVGWRLAGVGLWAVASVLVQACSADASRTPTPGATIGSRVDSSTPRPSLGATGDDAAAAAIAAALAAAAAHAQVTRDTLNVSRVEPREWSDAGLGCGQPGQMYAQVVTPGYLVVVVTGQHELEYHTDTRGRAVLCAER